MNRFIRIGTLTGLFGAALYSQVTVTIRVQVPSQTRADDRITVAGNVEELGNWNPSVVRLSRAGSDDARRTFTWDAGTRIEFKITRGSWDTEAIYVPGVIPGNATLIVRSDTTVTLRPIGWRDNLSAGQSTASGQYRRHTSLAWTGLQESRDIVVRLPASYTNSLDRRYPVLYMHDGQNCFDNRAAAFGWEWRVDEVADSLFQADQIGEIIIVGVNNTQRRIQEYSDTPEGVAYADFLVNGVKRLVDSVYRTLPDRQNTAAMGSSMGGLISFLCHWWHPEVFGKAAGLSGVFDRMRTRAISMVEGSARRSRQLRFYLDCGGAGGDETLKPGIDVMAAALRDRGYKAGKDFQSYFEPSAEHNERAWAARLWRPMLFLFGKNTQ